MTIHLQRKNAATDSKYPYQRLSYDIIPSEDGKLSISEITSILNEFAKRSNGEFDYCITGPAQKDEEGNTHFGEVLAGHDFFKQNNAQE